MVVVEGEPIGKGRPRVSSRSGTVYTPRKTVAYEDALRFAAKLSKDRLGMAPAIAIIRAFSEPPTSWSQKKKKVAARRQGSEDHEAGYRQRREVGSGRHSGRVL